MEAPGGAAWPARRGHGDSSSIGWEGPPASPTWEPPQKKVRNNFFHARSDAYESQEAATRAMGDGKGGFSPRFPHQSPVHAAGEQFNERRQNFGPSGHGQVMPAYDGEDQMQSRDESFQGTFHATGRNFNMPSQNTASSPGFPPGSAKGTGALFFKTKLCTKFKLGACTFNERCHFAHGIEDLRRPPAGWEIMAANSGQGGPFPGRVGDGNLQQRKKSLKPCRFFAEGKECPYGEGCTFVHAANDDGYLAPQFGSTEGGDLAAPRFKTRMCARWERGEACNYGERCNYAHGYAEMQNESGFSGYGVDSAPSANNVHYPSPSLGLAHSTNYISNSRTMNTFSPAVATSVQSNVVANASAPSAAYPTTGTGVQQPADNFVTSQGYWNGALGQSGVADNQTSGSWTGLPIAGMGLSQGLARSVQHLPVQVQQPTPLGQSYSAQQLPVQVQQPTQLGHSLSIGNIGVLPESQTRQNVNSVQQLPKQMVPVPYMQNGVHSNAQTEAVVGHVANYSVSYMQNPSL